MGEISENLSERRFELKVEGHLAIIEYVKKDDKIYLTHTHVPKALEGKGIGSRLISGTLDLIGGKPLKIVAICPFIKAWISRHPEKQNLIYHT